MGTAAALPFPNGVCLRLNPPARSAAGVCAAAERQVSRCLFRAQECPASRDKGCCKRSQTGTKVGTASLHLFYSVQLCRKKIVCPRKANAVKKLKE